MQFIPEQHHFIWLFFDFSSPLPATEGNPTKKKKKNPVTLLSESLG